MSEETTQPTPSTTPEPSTEPSLEDVYKQYHVSEPQAQPQPTPQPQPAPSQPEPEVSIPDAALDPDGYRQWARQRLMSETQIKQALNAVAGRIHQYEAAQTKQREEADIQRAVEVIREKVDADPDLIEIAIAQKARKDPRFMSLWANRAKNPQAWNAGLKAAAGELAGKLAMRQDPQITENLRAAKQSQQTQATSAPEDDEKTRLGRLSLKELDRELDKYRRTA